MFRPMLMKPYRTPLLITAVTSLGLVWFAVTVLGAEVSPSAPSTASFKDFIQYVMGVAGFVSLVVGVGWGLINRKKYDKLKETIDDLTELIEAKEKRIEEITLSKAEMESRFNLRIVALEQAATNLGIVNEGIVSHNLQMKAILKKLRLEGKWEGHEDDIFSHKAT